MLDSEAYDIVQQLIQPSSAAHLAHLASILCTSCVATLHIISTRSLHHFIVSTRK